MSFPVTSTRLGGILSRGHHHGMTHPTINNLRAIRHQKGLTIKQVAEYLGLKSDARISLWERGLLYPHVLNFLKLITLYGVRAEEVYGTTLEGVDTIEP